MSTSEISTLEDAIRQSGEGWLIDSYNPQQEAMDHIRRTLQLVQDEATKRLGKNAPSLSEESLVAEYKQHPGQVRGFFQALGGTRTPEMLLMVWRLIQGMEVKEVQLQYHRQQSFKLKVVLESPYEEEDRPYSSTNIFDFALFRHIGIMEISGRPVLDGFYALKVKGV